MYMYIIIYFSAIWVYFDATKNKIGKIPGNKSFANMSAGAWAIVTLMLWIVAFPLYLFKRSSLIEKAQEEPQKVSLRGLKLAALIIIPILIPIIVVMKSAYEDYTEKSKEAYEKTLSHYPSSPVFSTNNLSPARSLSTELTIKSTNLA